MTRNDMTPNHMTDPGEFIASLEGGLVEQSVAIVLSKVAAAVVDHRKKGQIKITVDLNRVGDSMQVNAKHKIEFTEPTAKGEVKEHSSGDTVLHIAPGGRMSLIPNTQTDLFTPKNQEETTNG